jgi:hypothetical protein
MPAMTDYLPGTPCWVDLSTDEPGKSIDYYTQLMNWACFTAPGPGGEAGGEGQGGTFFAPAGTSPAGISASVVAGLAATGGGTGAGWNTYVSVTDADATAGLVEGAGGAVLVPPSDVGGQGRVAMFADDQGALIGAWQPAAFRGAGQVNEPGSFCWSELACRDPAAAARFYGRVFGWEPTTSQLGPMTYSEWRLSGYPVAGMVHMDENWPPGISPHWAVYFGVEDCDGAAARAAELGGLVAVPPTDVPAGRIAVLTDPQGVTFTIMRLGMTSPAS